MRRAFDDAPANGKFADGTTDIQRANMRMVYENPADYAAWRKRMGMVKEIEGRGDPMMRSRIAKLLRELVDSL